MAEELDAKKLELICRRAHTQHLKAAGKQDSVMAKEYVYLCVSVCVCVFRELVSHEYSSFSLLVLTH